MADRHEALVLGHQESYGWLRETIQDPTKSNEVKEIAKMFSRINTGSMAAASLGTWFLVLLWRHIVCERQGIGLISDRHQGILQCVQTHDWLQPPSTHHRFCIRHLKSNFNKKFLNSDHEKLMWLAATEHQKKKYKMRIEQIKTMSPLAYLWLKSLPKDKWTWHKNNGHRWGAMTTNVSESYNGLLKKAHGLPDTLMNRYTFKNLVDRFVERSTLADLLIADKKFWPRIVEKKFDEYWERSLKQTDMQQYNATELVFEILTFAHEGKGGNIHKVSAEGKKCSCGKWRNYHMPCSHAIKFCDIRGIQPKDYVSKYYSCRFYKQTYSENFSPLGDEAYWPPSPFSLIANTEYERTSRTRTTTRRRNEMDIAPVRMARKCSTCKQTGHNKNRCPDRNQ
ncbi:uncharacterized protein LOC132053999 [Lycium ferocissimum]|uniref:uncharacterized protein LOC132053999 n=1 Tax=Lycium ferocissimum TaxID=112874 RepID=UPI002814A9D9|nr:uncharacterized protein LOC132053999 [Lycium ferocissimum]